MCVTLISGLCAALCAAPIALVGACCAVPTAIVTGIFAIPTAIISCVGSVISAIGVALIPIFGATIVDALLDLILGLIVGTTNDNDGNSTIRSYNGTYSITEHIFGYAFKEPECDYNDVEQLLSQYLNSSSFSIPSLNTSLTSTPQERALLWLKYQNETEVERCDPYSTLQRYVLALLYYSTNGIEWIQQGKFLSNETVCSWNGVFCDDNSIIAKKLVLEKNNLQGSIPDELGSLKYLEKLQLSSNSLIGTLPSTLGDLVLLEEINIGGNALTGSIPEELGNIPTLAVISLYENDLNGSIPSNIGALENLKGLFVFDNNITGNVTEFCATGSLAIKVDCDKVEECKCCLC